ncbi:MAG: hypothetical protein QE271_12220 [Bacteriovoracaceae bacterium]|nr:hypothetical protein [Bacteriovoracaceae bacterium]
MQNNIIFFFFLGWILTQNLCFSLETKTEAKNELKSVQEKLSQKMDQISLSNIQANLLEISQLRDSLDALKDKSLKNCQKKDFSKDQKHQCLISLKDDYQSIIENYYQARLRYLDIIHKHYQQLLGQERKALIEQLNKEATK